MANVTDPLVASLSGSDPQNAMEYITRQKIYDCRFWKEECFGLSAVDVLEKAATSLRCAGGIPGTTRFLSLTLKLLQLSPDGELVRDSFIEQEGFKYVRALGCLYLRLTGRPADIYASLEPLYSDSRKLRFYDSASSLQSPWRTVYVDEFVHDLLTQPIVVGIALPRLPSRDVLSEAGYLPDGPRATQLQQKLDQHGGSPLDYLKYKALVEKSPAAIALWEKRQSADQEHHDRDHYRSGERDVVSSNAKRKPEKERLDVSNPDQDEEEGEIAPHQASIDNTSRKERKKQRSAEGESRKTKKQGYGSLFKKDNKSSSTSSKHSSQPTPTTMGEQEGSEEYWNEQRAKLGLKPLKK